MRRPASELLRWAARVFGDEAAARIFAPLVADWQRDRQAAPTTMRRLGRDLSGSVALLMTAAHVATRLALPWGLPRRDVTAIGVTFIAYAAIGLAVGLAPFVLAPLVSDSLRPAFLVMVTPGVLTVSLPVALLPTAAAIRHRSRSQWHTRAPWLLAAMTAVSMAVLVANVGWVTPAATQEFRERSVRTGSGPASAPENEWRLDLLRQREARRLPRGVRELTLPELFAETPARVYPTVTGSARRQEAVLRVALMTVWPLTFALFGWHLAHRRSARGVIASSVWWMLAVVTTLLVTLGDFFSPGPDQVPRLAAAAATWVLAAGVMRRQRAAHR